MCLLSCCSRSNSSARNLGAAEIIAGASAGTACVEVLLHLHSVDFFCRVRDLVKTQKKKKLVTYPSQRFLANKLASRFPASPATQHFGNRGGERGEAGAARQWAVKSALQQLPTLQECSFQQHLLLKHLMGNLLSAGNIKAVLKIL